MSSKSRLPAIGMALAVFSFMGADAALAQADAHPAAGAIKLNNVRIEHAPQLAVQAPQAAGMRAYIDPATGELRDQTPEEAMEAGTKSAFRSAPVAKSLAASPFGGFVAELDESFMLNAMATRDASGRLRMQCVPASGVQAFLKGSHKEAGHAH